ncbi:hypothetical protein QR685DRAFT_533720 [Neurospora intermedia]|uniref:Uncharacterized protein n=1 Tax=Neurospora intermedia TaxID=5142 RepID=A0ABR3D3F1_NEUIN
MTVVRIDEGTAQTWNGRRCWEMPDLQTIFSGHRRPWPRFLDADAPATSPPIRGQIQHKTLSFPEKRES